MSWIEPLSLEVWFVNVFSGTSEIFGAIAIIIIAGLAAYFKMNGVALAFMLGLFVFMFSPWIGDTFLILFSIIGGILIYYWISKIVQK